MKRRRAAPDPAIRQRNRNWCNHHFRDPDARREADLPCRGGRQVHDAAFYVRTAVFDVDDGAHARVEVSDLRHCSEREGPACSVVTARIHWSPIRHGSAKELACVERSPADTLACRQVWLLRRGDALWSTSMSALGAWCRGDRRQRDRKRGGDSQRCCSGKALHMERRVGSSIGVPAQPTQTQQSETNYTSCVTRYRSL